MTAKVRFLRHPLPMALLCMLTGFAPAQAVPATRPAATGLPYIAPQLTVDPPEGLLADAWYRLTLHDQPMGYMRTAIQRKGDRIESLEYVQIRVSRGPITIKVILKTVNAETLAGEPLEIHTEQVMGNQPVKYDAFFRPNGSIDLEITQGGNTISRKIAADRDATLPWRKTLDILQGRHKPGDSFVERAYAFVSDTKPLEVTNSYQGKTQFTLPSGKTIPALRYKVTNPGMAADSEVVCEPQLLIPLKLDVPVLGSMVLTASIASRDQVMASDTEKPAELFESLMVRANILGPGDPSHVPSVLYTIKVKGDAKGIDLISTDMQQVISRQASNIKLQVTRRQVDEPTKPVKPIQAKDLARYRAASAYANCDDPVIRQMAAEAVGAEADPITVATRLTHYVYQKMTRKDLDVAFATASEAARTLEGDCTEHAVLLAALARARHLPARGTFGMVALPGSYEDGQILFGYHMWTQIYINGRWMDFDAALDQPRPDATHIALGIADLSDAAMPQESVKVFTQMAGALQLIAEPRE